MTLNIPYMNSVFGSDIVAGVAIPRHYMSAPIGIVPRPYRHIIKDPDGAKRVPFLNARVLMYNAFRNMFPRSHVAFAPFVLPGTFWGAGEPTVSNHSTLPTNLKAYWKLDEASGTRYDSKGSNDLTDVSSVSSMTGNIDALAAVFSSDYLERNDTDDISTGNRDFSMNCWWYPQSGIGNGDGAWYKAGEWYFRVDGDSPSGDLEMRWGEATLKLRLNICNFYSNLNTWRMLSFTYDVSDNGGYTYDNGSEFGSGTASGYPADSANKMRLGWGYYGYMNCGMSHAAIWHKELTTTEITDLYNSGDGLPYD